LEITASAIFIVPDSGNSNLCIPRTTFRCVAVLIPGVGSPSPSNTIDPLIVSPELYNFSFALSVRVIVMLNSGTGIFFIIDNFTATKLFPFAPNGKQGSE
jgi:hypothetical protein